MFIRNAIIGYLNIQRQDLVRKQIKTAIKGGQAAPAPKNKQKGGGVPLALAGKHKAKAKAKANMGNGTPKRDKPCFRERDHGTCDIPGCEYMHAKPTMAAPPDRRRPKGGGRNKSKSRSPSPKGSKKPCIFYAKGTCKNGSNCKYEHRKSQSPTGSKGKAKKPRSKSPSGKGKRGKGRR